MSLQDSLKNLNELEIRDIDFSRIGVWPVAAKVAVCALIVGLVLGVTWYFFIDDLKIRLAGVENKELELRAEYQRKSFEAANLEAYKEQMADMQTTFEGLLSRLPARNEIPGLLEDIGQRGSESGLAISAITIQKDRAAEYYIEVPINIEAQGGYHDIGNFVSGVAAMARIVTLHDFNITSRAQGGALNLKIVAQTYRYKSPEEEAAR